MAAINVQSDYENTVEKILASEEMKSVELFRDCTTAIHQLSKLRVVSGKYKTALTTAGSFQALIRENKDIATSEQEWPKIENNQIADEGIYNE